MSTVLPVTMIYYPILQFKKRSNTKCGAHFLFLPMSLLSVFNYCCLLSIESYVKANSFQSWMEIDLEKLEYPFTVNVSCADDSVFGYISIVEYRHVKYKWYA